MATLDKNGHNGSATAELTRPVTNGASQSMTKTQPSQLQRRDDSWNDPFTSMQRLASEMDAIFESFGFGRSPLFGRRGSGLLLNTPAQTRAWTPQLEMEDREGNLIVRADLPGLTKDDVQIHLEDDTLTLSGERKDQREENKDGFYHSERFYGSFRRSIQLPAGIDPDAVKANFRNGVLEITMPSPKLEQKARRIEVGD